MSAQKNFIFALSGFAAIASFITVFIFGKPFVQSSCAALFPGEKVDISLMTGIVGVVTAYIVHELIVWLGLPDKDTEENASSGPTAGSR